MSYNVDFAYAQARMQARHGRRLNEQEWAQLSSTHDLGRFLQLARNSSLRPWVLQLGVHTGLHDIERTLRQELVTYIQEVATWQPDPWQEAVRWTQWLPYLPALQHLLQGESPMSWMLDAPALKLFVSEDMTLNTEALSSSICAPLYEGWHAGLSLVEAWCRHWLILWPSSSPDKSNATLEKLAERLQDHLDTFADASIDYAQPARERLRQELQWSFRRHTQQPATAFIHLALVALDLERLRGELVSRRIHTGWEEDAA